jgi:hypothetical protein
MSGVLKQEVKRRAKWERLGLPDPLSVLAAERIAQLYDRHFRHPLRRGLDCHFRTHPSDRPKEW